MFAETPAPKPVADASLEPGLLGTVDFPSGFSVSNMTQAELDQLPTPEIPQTVNPTECSGVADEGYARTVSTAEDYGLGGFTVAAAV